MGEILGEIMMNFRLVLLIPAALALLAPLAAAQQTLDLPPRKPGQWEVRMVSERPVGGLNVTSQMCIDAATDREMMEFGLKMSKGSCPRFDMKRAGATTWVIDAECTFGPVKSVTKTTISGDFQKTLTVRIEGTMDGVPGGGQGPQPTLMTQTATWKAATCADGMKPGDLSLGNGLKMNVKQMKELQQRLPNIQIK
ncbi:MAG: hypothetical protein K2X43_02770 [Hyphomonadaceae bacterium]|jgi:hypothetical protein|nr:hypothetical protein [Hyphomonadaceae bacterium]